MPTPVYNVIAILREALVAALDPLTARPVRWVEPLQADELPYAISQSQDSGGAALEYVGAIDWTGLVTLRACATTLPAAEALMNSLAPGMEVLTHAGVAITTKYNRPLTLPPVDGVYQAGHIWRVTISAQ
jgi:hypothetical protein